MGDKPRTELLGALLSLYQSRDYADLVIFGRDASRHPVHRAIVCPRSSFFYDAVKEGRWREGIEGHLLLPDEEPEVVRLLIEYLYLLDYEPLVQASEDVSSSHGDGSDSMSIRTEPGTYGHVYGAAAVSAFGGPLHSHSAFEGDFSQRRNSQLTVHALPSGDFHGTFGRHDNRRPRSMVIASPDPSPLATAEPNLILHARMYAAGHRYSIEGLKALALDKFKIQLTRHWDSKEFAETIHVVYSTTPSSDKDMREAIADTLGWHGRLLYKSEIETAVMDINGLAYELLKRSRRAEPEYM